ncbi:BCL2/adenovirus E1B 19 kDa protein-interacting protein 3 [Melipona quadrifasciata]|uniref:BCL2/adenovirus E1B 19 kDa protein-interacting protein 3 n=1 Tax=Melipona quadrifasciata TaxID=166423 RepID=A0A0M9AA31_9HYME|nr:BCL2/adenovirus E1B 19 kDa protein-interacting protein 3 [Melipona quadrifasciata]
MLASVMPTANEMGRTCNESRSEVHAEEPTMVIGTVSALTHVVVFTLKRMWQSWVELNPVPDRITPLPFSSGGEEYLRLLREAQRDSLPSSARHSLASSRRGTPRDSPKSPPNSPNTELSTEDELKGVYINYCCNKETELLEKNTDWIYEWSSRPDQMPPKDWRFKHPQGLNKRKSYSIRTTKVGKIGLFSKEVLYTLFITNILSVLVGAGLGVWLSRRGSITSSVTIE